MLLTAIESTTLILGNVCIYLSFWHVLWISLVMSVKIAQMNLSVVCMKSNIYVFANILSMQCMNGQFSLCALHETFL